MNKVTKMNICTNSLDKIRTTMVNNHGYSIKEIDEEIGVIIGLARYDNTDTIIQEILDGVKRIHYIYEWKIFNRNTKPHAFINKITTIHLSGVVE